MAAGHIRNIPEYIVDDAMVLLPDSKIAVCACAGNAGSVFPATVG